MNGVTMQAPPKFIQSPRIQKLAQRSRELAISGKRNLYGGDVNDAESMVYGWFGKVPPPVVERMVLGDHACWIDIGPFPKLDQMPSKVNGYEATGESWGRDYAFLRGHFPGRNPSKRAHRRRNPLGNAHGAAVRVAGAACARRKKRPARAGRRRDQHRAHLPGPGDRPHPRAGAASWSAS